jgi:hypothetical protein
MAKGRCALAKTYAERSGSARAMLSASIAEGLVEVASGKADIGLSRLMKLLDQARVIRTAYRDALYALIAAHQMLGDNSRGEVYVRELMLQTRATQREYLKGHTRRSKPSPLWRASKRPNGSASHALPKRLPCASTPPVSTPIAWGACRG